MLSVSRCNILPLHETISKHCLRISALGLLFSKATGQRHNAGSTLRLHPAPNLLQCLSYIVGTTYKNWRLSHPRRATRVCGGLAFIIQREMTLWNTMHFVVGNTLLFSLQIIYRRRRSLEPQSDLKALLIGCAAKTCLTHPPKTVNATQSDTSAAGWSVNAGGSSNAPPFLTGVFAFTPLLGLYPRGPKYDPIILRSIMLQFY